MESSLEGGFAFQWGRGFGFPLDVGVDSFLSGGSPMSGIGFDRGGGGKKNRTGGLMLPIMRNPGHNNCFYPETLIVLKQWT